MDDEYYDQDGHEYEMTVAQEEAWQEESYQEGLLSDLYNSINGNDYLIDRQIEVLQRAFNVRGYKIVPDQ